MAREVIDKIIYETTSDKTCTVVGFDKKKRPVNIVIPEEVTIEGNSYVVTEICEKAFYSCSTLRSIKLPSSLVEIGAEAFNLCYNLKSIAIPSKITILQDYLFHCCTALESVIIPESVTYIGEAVFKACNVLKQVEIPDSVTNIGRFAFQFCYELTEIKLPKGLTHISICSFHECKALTNIFIPESVTSIGSYAFAKCESLTKVDLPKGVISIDEEAFLGCDKLNDNKLPNAAMQETQNGFCEDSSKEVESPNNITVETVENKDPKDLKQLELYKGVKYLYIWEGKKVLVYKDKLVIDDLTLPVENAQSYHCEGGVFYQLNNDEEHYQVYRFDGNSFVKENFRYDFDKYITPNLSCSSEYDEEEKMVKVSIVDNGEESLFEFPSQNNISVLRYDVEHDVLILGVGYNWSKSLHFYTKTGKKLWQYNVREEKFWIEDEGNLIIVDDVIVITCTNENDHINSVAGYNLRTGEKLWDVDDLQYCTHHYEIGPDKMLYYVGNDVRNDRRKDFYLIQLNPFTGNLKKTLLIKGSNDYIIPNGSKIFGNKLYFTREISEYSYKKCKRTWTLNHIDLETKEFTEIIINSNEHCISIPEFHENKMYIDICWRELRVYEMDGDTPVMVDAPKKKRKTLDDLDEIDVLKAITGCKCTKTKDLSGEYEKLRKEGKEKGFIPVLVGFDDYVRDSICSNIGVVDNTVSLVKKEVKTYHEKMLAMAVEDGKSFLHKKWTAEPTEEDEQRILKAKKSRRNTMEGTFTQNMRGTLYWVKVPVSDPWLIWVYLPYGGWNACPDVKTQIAVSKYWYEQYQALPIGIYGACVDYYLEKPLTTPFKAAKEMYEYCCDIIEQGHNDINILAKDIKDLNFWNFWWD